MLNITYFSNQFSDRHGHGLCRYSRELFAGLKGIGEEVNITPVSAWSSLDGESLVNLQQQSGLQMIPLGRRLTPLAWTFLNNPPIEKLIPGPVDVVHAVSLGYSVATRKPYVVTVHDLGPLTHPEFFGNTSPWIMKKSLDQMVKKADAVICVSESTADELITYVGTGIEERVRVIYEGVSPSFFDQSSFSCLEGLNDLPEPGVPFVLATGKISPRKNIQGLIEAMSRLAGDIPHHLVLVGGDGWDMDEVFQQLDNPEIKKRVHFPGYVTDEQLKALYQRASVYVHPSLYEGFGLTVLEAMAAGCPVITSNVYSLPEVAGDAAVLIDPTDIEALADAIQLVCGDSCLAKRLAEKGINRAQTFQWEKCALQVADVYKSIS